jgi:hypothetical protein
MINYNAFDWYFIKEDKTEVFSTKYHKYVSTTDEEYLAWLADESHTPTRHPKRNGIESITQIYENIKMFKLDRESLLKAYIDSYAQSLRYENITTLLNYINSSNEQWKNEALAGQKFLTSCYEKYFELINTNEDIPWSEMKPQLPKLPD